MRVEPATCPVCRKQYDPLRSRAVAVVDGKVRAFCSNECKNRRNDVTPPPVDHAPAGFSWRARVAAMGMCAVVIGVGWRLSYRQIPRASASLPLSIVPVRPVVKVPSTAEALAMLKGTDDANDVWFHPLYGPRRHLPEHNTRRFGAAREGLRPDECDGGHCGVDLGTTKGQPVIAAHDGVVERVQRDASIGGRRGNEGRFLRINHKGGTIVTSYMHLDTIREDLRPGIPVKAGEEVGTIGDTGVLRSGPHLHFAVSVRAAPEETETFIDPEPMLHLWPLKRAVPLSASTHRTASMLPLPRGG